MAVPEGRASELSDAEILVFMTQDAMPADRELIGALVAALAGESTGRSRLCATASKKGLQFPGKIYPFL